MTARQIQEGDIFEILDFGFLDFSVITYIPPPKNMYGPGVGLPRIAFSILGFFPNVGFYGLVLIPVII